MKMLAFAALGLLFSTCIYGSEGDGFAVADETMNLFKTACLENISVSEPYVQRIGAWAHTNDLQLLANSKSGLILGGQKGVVWGYSKNGVDYSLSLTEKGECAVTASKSDSASLRSRFSKIIDGYSSTYFTSKEIDGPSADCPSEVLGYRISPPEGKLALFMLLVTTECKKEPIKAMAAVSLTESKFNSSLHAETIRLR